MVQVGNLNNAVFKTSFIDEYVYKMEVSSVVDQKCTKIAPLVFCKGLCTKFIMSLAMIKITCFMWQETIHSFNRYLLCAYYVPGASLGIWDIARAKSILASSLQEQILPWRRALQNHMERKWLTSLGISVGQATGNCQQISHGIFSRMRIFQSGSSVMHFIQIQLFRQFIWRLETFFFSKEMEISLNKVNWIQVSLSHRVSPWWSWPLFPLPRIWGGS